MNVTVIDSIMGAGKTSFAIQTMKNAPETQKFIYITPFLDEVERIKESVPERNFKEPDIKHGHGTKLSSLKKLVSQGENIVTTHSLFSMIDNELKELFEWENYILIIDEVMEVISQLKTVKRDDIPVMLKSGLIEIEPETNRVIWTADTSLNTKYNDVKQYALSGNLYAVNGVAFLWSFPAQVFDLFDHTFILTYLFEGQLQKYYYDYHSIKYEKKSVIQENGVFKLVPYFKEDRQQFKELISIYEGKLNNIGDKETALSKSWFTSPHNKPKITRLKHDLYSYFRTVQKAKSEQILWTTFKDSKANIHGKGFSKVAPKGRPDIEGTACFIPFTTRATNKYKHKSVLAFCLNRYMNPLESHFFKQRNIEVDQDLLALSDMLQWIFRSRVREGQPIEIYIPSKRMRKLLRAWLDSEI
ncbi:DEAD/DEAH box helicase family protein [Cytobacillus sp. NJ13]|nr:DEAD/DEAH box helicase family protein [Cytobacillus sp. NJ13]